MILILFKIMIIFNNTSADFVLISVENDHNFGQNEDCATAILKWADFCRLKKITNTPHWIESAELKGKEYSLFVGIPQGTWSYIQAREVPWP